MFRNGLVLVRAVSLAVLAVVALASPRIVLAQATASITGTLRGQGGDPVSGVRVAFEPGGIVVETDARGGFRLSVPAATAGVLQFAAVGFSPEERAVAPLAPGEVRQIAATLRPLHLLPPIAVDAARTRPLLETQGAATGGSIEAAEVAALPTDARNPIALLYNVPGVAQATAYFGDAPTLSLNGANSLYTVYTLDGLDDNEGFLGGPRVDLPLSAVRRMDAWVNSYSALYGRSSNGGVDRQTIRGSNARTGSVFVYWRPGRPIDGQNQVPFGEVAEAVARRQEGFQRIQVGGSVAGPLVRDRTVYAMAAEYTAEQEDRIGSTALTPFLGTEDRRTVKLFGRLDHAWTPSQATTLRFALSSLSRAGEGNGVITPEADVTTRRVGSLTALSHRSSFGEGRGSNTASLQVGTFRWFFPPTVSDFSRPQVTVISPARAVQAVVGSSNFVFDERETQLQLRNVVEVSTRRHTLRAGGEVITSQFALAAAGTNPNGAYVVFNDGNIPVPSGRSLTIADIPSGVRVESYTVDANPQQVDLTQTVVGAFLTDLWRVSPAVTLEFGLRWDYDDLTSRGQSDADLNNFQPRASFNWYRTPTSVVRGGIGIYTGKFPYAIYSDAIQLGPDGNATVTFVGSDAPAYLGGPTPAELQQRRDQLPPREVFETFALGLEQPSSVQATLGWQQQLGATWALAVDAVWSETSNLPRNVDLNASPLRITPGDRTHQACASAFECPADGTRPVAPVPGGVRRLSTSASGGGARYMALYTSVRRTAGRLTLDANWVWSRAQNDTEDINFTAAEANCFSRDLVDAVTGAPCTSSEWADANNDRRHKVTLRSILHASADLLVSLIADWQTGQPVNRLAGSSGLDGNATFDLLGVGPVRGSAFLGNGPRFFGVPRNGERLPSYLDLRTSVQYRVPLRGRSGPVFRLDAFNLLNRTNWGGYPIGLGGAGSRIQYGNPGDPIRLFSPGPPRQVQLSASYQF